jgi:hypothetical protein
VSAPFVVMPAAELLEKIEEVFARKLAEHAPSAKPADMVSTPDMAKRLGISRAKLHQLAGEDDAPFVWVGDTRRWPPAETIAWLKARGRVAK